MKKKLLSVLLVVCMVLTLMPMAALADFADTEGHWGKDAIDRWADVGVLNGKGDGIFDPNGSMTRAEFAQMLCNMMGYTKKAPNTFVDVPDGAWYADAMLKLVQAGVINGKGANMAAPNDKITREEACVMLQRAFKLQTKSTSLSYADASSVSSWARGAVATLTEMGMLSGVGDNQVAPQMNINRASVATLINNMVEDYVTESKTITGEVNGIVVVAADAKVTFEDATVNAPILVAPAAAGAEVELTGTTTAENVVVAAEKAAVTVGKDAAAESVTAAAEKAEVNVEGTVDTVEVTEAAEGAKTTVAKDAEVKDITVAAPKAETEVAGKVESVEVAEAAEGAKTTVGKDAEVKDITVAAPKAETEVAGKVENVVVEETATGAEITAASGAKIDSVTTSAEDVKVSGSGEVGSVTAEAGSVDVGTKGTEVTNNGADEVTAGSTTVEEGETATSDGSTGSSSGGGSGSGSKPSSAKGDYKVTVTYVAEDISGYGRVAASKTAANEGDEVTLTVTVNAGFKLGDLTVSGDGVSLTPAFSAGSVAGSYTFTMPGADVTVTATFEALEDGQVTVTFKNADNSTISTVTGTKGEKVSFPEKSAPDGYWVSGKWQVDGVEGLTETEYTIPGDSTAKALTIKADGKKYVDQTKNTIVRPNGPAGDDGSFDYAAAYTAAGIGYTKGSGKITVNLTNTDKLFADSKAVDSSDAKTLAEKRISALTHGENLYIGVALEGPSNAVSAYLGDTARDIPSNLDGFDFYKDGNKIYFIDYYAAVKAANGEPLDPTTYEAPKVVWIDEDGNALRADIFTVSLAQASGGDYKKVTVSSSIKNGKVVASPMTVKPSGEVTLTVTPNEGYKLKTLTVSGATVTLDPEFNDEDPKGSYTFEMPEGDVTVNATFEAIKYDITVDAATNGTVKITGATAVEEADYYKATAGTTVTVTPNADDGYEVDTIEVKDSENSKVIVSKSNQFTMPADTVTVTVTFKKIDYAIKYMDGTTAITDVGGATTTANVGEDGNIEITLPTLTNTNTKYYTGWKMGTTALTPAEGKVKVDKPTSGTTITLTAQSLTIDTQTVTTRGEGPATGKDEDVSYKDMYDAIGAKLEGTTLSVDAAELTKENVDAALLHTIGSTNHIFFGIQFTTPTTPTGITQVAVARNVDGLDAENVPTFTLSENKETKDGDVRNGQFIEYISVGTATVEGETISAVTPPTAGTYTYFFKWMKEDGSVAAVTTVTITLTVTSAPVED